MRSTINPKQIDIKKFNELFLNYQQRLTFFAKLYVRDTAVAEDCAISAFSTLWEKRETIDCKKNVLTYLLTVIKNNCIDYLRHKQHDDTLPNDDEVWELNDRINGLENLDPSAIYKDEIQEIIERTLAELSPQTRNIFILKVYENRTHSEIANMLGISDRGVEYHLYKAKDRLREELKDYMPLILLYVYFC